MVAERAMAPGATAPCSDQNNQAEFITPEPTPATCAFCGDDRDVYRMGDDKWICVEHIGRVVSLAANGVFSHCVSYSREFETAVLL